MLEKTLPAKTELLDDVLEFVASAIKAYDCSEDIQSEIAMAVEEIYVNIAHYAYNPEVGPATIRVKVEEEPVQVIIQMIDGGMPYNPLERENPDTDLSLEEREIGGLGIFMVKNMMDGVDYSYQDGKNILTVKKYIK